MSRRKILLPALLLLLALCAAAVTVRLNCGWYLVLSNADTGHCYARFPMAEGDTFSVTFVHSVNKSPVTDCYQVQDGTVFVEQTIYYGFGAGVQTELEGDETLTYGEDGSMIVSGFHRPIPDLIYFVGTVSDHTMIVNGGDPISLRTLCGRSSKVRFQWTWCWF